MREIEIKVRVNDPGTLLSALEKQGISLTPPVKQHDVVYAEPGVKDNAPDSVWLRIRTENDTKTIFTLKKQHTGGLDSIEHETVVEDATELEAIIKEMGFELYSDLTKIRQKGHLGIIELCYDEVPGLGTFIEAEKMMEHDADHDEAVAELWQIFNDLGLQKQDEIHDGYDVLERRQRGL